MTEQPKSDVQLCCEALAAAQQVWLEHEQAQRLTSSGLPSEVDELRQQLATWQRENDDLRRELANRLDNAQQLAAMQAERNEARGEAAMALAECDAMQFRLTQVGRERDAARAGLGRAVDVVRDLHAECCMPWVTVVRDQYTLRMQPVLKRAEQICADPLGQQALAEWQHLKTVAGHVLKVKADGWYFSDPELAAAVEALVALQQQPAAGEGQQDG